MALVKSPSSKSAVAAVWKGIGTTVLLLFFFCLHGAYGYTQADCILVPRSSCYNYICIPTSVSYTTSAGCTSACGSTNCVYCAYCSTIGYCESGYSGCYVDCAVTPSNVCAVSASCAYCSGLGYCTWTSDACATSCTATKYSYCSYVSTTTCASCSVGYCRSAANLCPASCSAMTSQSECGSGVNCHWCTASGGFCTTTSTTCPTDCSLYTSVATCSQYASACRFCHGVCVSVNTVCVQTHTPSPSKQFPSFSWSVSEKVSMSRSKSGEPTSSKSYSALNSVSIRSISLSKTLTPSSTRSLPTFSATSTPSLLSVTQTSISPSVSSSGEPSSRSVSLSKSTSLTETISISRTSSNSGSMTTTITSSISNSASFSHSKTISVSLSVSNSHSAPTASRSMSSTNSLTASESLTISSSSSVSPTFSISTSASSTSSTTLSLSMSLSRSTTTSASSSTTLSLSMSLSRSTTTSASPSTSLSLSVTFSASATTSWTWSVSYSYSISSSLSVSSFSQKVSFSDKVSQSHSISSALTLSVSASSTLSTTLSSSSSNSYSDSGSWSHSETSSPSVTLSRTFSNSATSSLTASDSLTASVSTSNSSSPTESHSASYSSTPSWSISETASLLPLAPQIASCFMQQALFYGSPFILTIGGVNFADNDTFAVASDLNACVALPPSSYHGVFWVSYDRRVALLQYQVDTTDPFAVCYRSPQLGTVFLRTCPQIFFPGAQAPWVNVTASLAIASAVQVAPGVSVAASNYGGCVSGYLPAIGRSIALAGGVLSAPVSGSMQFGNVSQRIRAGEVCMVFVRQESAHLTPATEGANAFNSSSVENYAYRFSFDSRLSASDVMMVWMENVSFVRSHFTEASFEGAVVNTDDCPMAIPGYIPVYRVPSGVSERRLPPAAMIVTTCAATVGRGQFASMSYTRSETVCPSDCRDGSGTKRGVCINETYECECLHPDVFGGPACTQPLTCSSGTDPGFTTNITDGSGTWLQSGNGSCSALLWADGSNVMVAGGFSIAFQVVQLSLSGDCSSASVVIREGSIQGPVIRQLCQSNAAMGKSIVVLNASRSIHVSYHGSAESDLLEIAFTSVSTVCPGDLDLAGHVLPGHECSGRGECVDLNLQSTTSFPASTKACSCYYPFAPSTPGATCDACADGTTPWTFPSCNPLPQCEYNCNGHGQCLSSGCVCDSPYYGRLCELTTLPMQLQAAKKLQGRVPLDRGSGATEGYSRSLISCQVTGCATSPRDIGTGYFAGNESLPTAIAVDDAKAPGASTATTASRRRSLAAAILSTTNSTAAGAADEGILLNTVRTVGGGEYFAVENVSGTSLDISGQTTVTVWTRLTVSSNGFLFAKTDSLRYADGRMPLLEMALHDVQDRHAPEEALFLRDTNSSVYFAVYVNGAAQAVDLFVADVEMRDNPSQRTQSCALSSKSCTGRDSWIYSRRFALNSHFRDLLFNGEWHFVAITMRKSIGRYEGQVYVDGGSVDGNTGFVQCMPFLPNRVTNASAQHTANSAIGNREITQVGDGGVFVIGYGLRAALDEIRLYSPPLAPRTMVAVAGTQFTAALSITMNALVFCVAASLGTMLLGGVLFLARRLGVKLELQARRVTQNADELSSDSGKDDDHCESDDEAFDEWLEAQKGPPSEVLHATSDFTEVRGFLSSEHPVALRSPRCGVSLDLPSTPRSSGVVNPLHPPGKRAAPPQLPSSPARMLSTSNTLPHHDTSSINMVIPIHTNNANFLDTAEAEEFYNMMSLRESKTARVARKLRSAAVAAGDAATSAAFGGAASGLAGETMLDGASMVFVQAASIVQEVWQIIALHIAAFPWPDMFVDTFATVIGIISLNFEVGLSIGFEIGFYVIAGVALTAFAVFCLVSYRDLLQIGGDEGRDAELRLRVSMYADVVPERNLAQKTAWFSLFILTTLYMPITRYSVIGAFCYRTIQCEFDCYNEVRHWRVVYVSVVLMVCITVMVPVILLWATFTKRQQFLRHRIDTNRNNAFVTEDVELELDWRQFLVADNSPYSGAYENFKFRWGYFQSEIVLSKALCVFLALGLDSDSTAQLVTLTVLHCVHAVCLATASPFVADVSNLISVTGLVFVLLTLGVNAISRIEPDETLGTACGYFLMVTASACFAGQAYLISRTVSIRDIQLSAAEFVKRFSHHSKKNGK